MRMIVLRVFITLALPICMMRCADAHMTHPQGHVFFVSTTGRNVGGDGSAGNPWESLSYAASRVSKGNTIRMGAGRFDESKPVHLALGVNLKGEGMDKTILCSTQPDAYLITLTSNKNATGNQSLSDFTIDGSNKFLLGGVMVENVNAVTLHNIHFLRCKESGSQITDSRTRSWDVEPSKYVTGIVIRNCKYTNCACVPFKKPDGTPAGMSGNLTLGGVDGAEVYKVDIEDIATSGTEDGYGIKFCSGGYYKNLKIHDCRIHVNEVAKAWVSNFCIELWNVGPGCEIANVEANTVFSLVNMDAFDQKVADTQNLRVHNCRIVNRKEGGSNNEAIEESISGLEFYDNYIENASLGIAMWGRGNHLSFHNNIFCNLKPMNKVWGQQFPPSAFWIDANGTYRDVKIFNNDLDGWEDGVCVAKTTSGSAGGSLDGLDIANNIFLHISRGVFEVTGFSSKDRVQSGTLRNNLEFACSALTLGAHNMTLHYNITGDPGLRFSGERWDGYYHPSSASSLCVGRGTKVGLPYQGPAPTIGCFEFLPTK